MIAGLTDFQPGWWVGVKYDEPLGKNNGTVAGRTYFKCADKYGAMVSWLSSACVYFCNHFVDECGVMVPVGSTTMH